MIIDCIYEGEIEVNDDFDCYYCDECDFCPENSFNYMKNFVVGVDKIE